MHIVNKLNCDVKEAVLYCILHLIVLFLLRCLLCRCKLRGEYRRVCWQSVWT